MMQLLRRGLLALLLVVSAVSLPAVAADYGRTTVGASIVDVEVDVQATSITVPGGETGVAIYAYLSTTNASTANCRAALYNPSDNTLAYQTSQVSFTDDVGSWREFPFTTVVPAGTYLLSVACGAIAGGLNTVNIAYDTVASSSNYRRATNAVGGSQSTYPTLPSPITWDGADGTQNVSLYFHTTVSSSSIPVIYNQLMKSKR